MSSHSLPSADLPRIIRASPPHVVTTVPLEPTSGVFVIDPSSGPPVGQWLGCIDIEIVKFGNVPFVTEFGVNKPLFRKLASAIGHVLSAKNAQFEHFLWCQFGLEFRM